MLFTLGFNTGKKSCPEVYVEANSLKEAHNKFYASELRGDFKTLININDFMPEVQYEDIHKGLHPALYGYRYGRDIEKEGMCIADSIQQVMDHFSNLDNLRGAWRITDDKSLLIT
jgi:hypothetical protein